MKSKEEKEEKEKMIEAMQELIDNLDSETTKKLSDSIKNTIENNPILSKKYKEFINQEMCTIKYTREHTEVIWKKCFTSEKKMAAVDIISHLLNTLRPEDRAFTVAMVIASMDMDDIEDDKD